MDTFDDAVAQLRSAEAGGFDFSETQAAKLLNEGLKRLASRSEWIRAELELGPTVTGQGVYVLPPNVVKVLRLAVNEVDYEWKHVTVFWDLRTGRKRLIDRGVFTERFSADGSQEELGIFPEPEEDGLPILGLASIEPDDLSGTDKLPFPPEYRRAALDYAKGIAYEDIDENQAAASSYFARADERADELRLQANARAGSGPLKIPVAGHRR